MAAQQTQEDDMIGDVSLSISNEFLVDFNSIAVDTETKAFRDLLGDVLFEDLGANPTKDKFVDLLDGVTWVDSDENLTQKLLTGMGKTLTYFVYYDWQNKLPAVNTFVGKVNSNNENSVPLDRQQNNIEIQDRYNTGIDFYREARTFVKRFEQFDSTYTTITESPAGTYTVLLSDTLYLEDGDTATIDSQEFTVTALVEDTSFVFIATTGLTFEDNGELFWTPFGEATNKELGKIFFDGMI